MPREDSRWRLSFTCAHRIKAETRSWGYHRERCVRGIFLVSGMVQVLGRTCSDKPYYTFLLPTERGKTKRSFLAFLWGNLKLLVDFLQKYAAFYKTKGGFVWICGGGGGGAVMEHLSSCEAFLSLRNAVFSADHRQVPHCRATCLNRESNTWKTHTGSTSV